MKRDDQQTAPVHVGLILDGNRRWARAKGLPTLRGHKLGYQSLKNIARHVHRNTDVEYLSVFAFSVENWKRSQEEVAYLMDLGLWMARHEAKEVHKEGIRLRFLGSKERLSDKLLRAIKDAEELTQHNTNGTLVVCFNYGGQEELVEAARRIVEQGLKPDEINAGVLAANLYAPDIPPVDLLIRTSGEHRTSGFMLYRAAYAELYFIDKYWPDFTPGDFDEALAWYANRLRRFGQ